MNISDNGQTCTVQNLSIHPAANEDVAQNLIFAGAFGSGGGGGGGNAFLVRSRGMQEVGVGES